MTGLRYNYIELYSKNISIVNLIKSHFQIGTEAYPDNLQKGGDESIPIWIIILSIVGGLLLLALLTFCLWRLGFFKRRRPDPTLSGNLEKNSENMLLIKNNK